jgi:dGTP triphosphohydrolase
MKRLENKTMDKNINEILCQIANKEDQTPYIIKNVEDGLKKRDEEITRLREENKRLRDEAYKDSKLQMMKRKMQAMQEELNRGFPITEDEDTKIREWIEKHLTKRHKLIVNGRFKYEFQDFAEVSVGSVVCTECGESFTFRQY